MYKSKYLLDKFMLQLEHELEELDLIQQKNIEEYEKLFGSLIPTEPRKAQTTYVEDFHYSEEQKEEAEKKEEIDDVISEYHVVRKLGGKHPALEFALIGKRNKKTKERDKPAIYNMKPENAEKYLSIFYSYIRNYNKSRACQEACSRKIKKWML